MAAARAGIVGWFIALAIRAVYLQGLHNDFLQAKGESRYSRVLSLGATRGMIVDRNNEPLAISTPVESVAASPADMETTPSQLVKLARLLEMDTAEVRRRLADSKREFVYLKRQLPPDQAEKIVELRKKLGKFTHLEDLYRIKGIKRKLLDRLRPKLLLDPPADCAGSQGSQGSPMK